MVKSKMLLDTTPCALYCSIIILCYIMYKLLFRDLGKYIQQEFEAYNVTPKQSCTNYRKWQQTS